MEHSEATATNAPERYLLGELTAAEADAFEEHYFECVQCADDLRVGAMFLEGGRQLVREVAEPVPAPAPVVQLDEHRPRRWPLWASNAAAAVMTFAFAGSLLLRGPAPSTVLRIAVADSVGVSDVRAAAGEELTLPGNAYIEVLQPDSPSFSHYELRVHGPDGRGVEPVLVSAEKANNPVPLNIPEGFAPGVYRVEIYGVSPAGSRHKLPQTGQFTVKALTGQRGPTGGRDG